MSHFLMHVLGNLPARNESIESFFSFSGKALSATKELSVKVVYSSVWKTVRLDRLAFPRF